MQKSVIFVLCGVLALAGAATFSGDEQAEESSLLSRLEVGQHVKLERAISGGYNVNILNDSYDKSFERADAKYVPEKITKVGRNFIVVDLGRGFIQSISANAIHVITELPDALPGKKEAAADNGSEDQSPTN